MVLNEVLGKDALTHIMLPEDVHPASPPRQVFPRIGSRLP